ncbi:hypothetical protein [Tenacibaculum halocynthiae]|uniref:hypothetical protein n=1 Tax=Tenacibaculum halocynthiae TaxID=1254437 RepID=UPI003D64C65D
MKWIKSETIFEELKLKSNDFFNKLGDNICVSEDYKYCLFLQKNNAWYIENEGWRDSNSKPEKDGESRLILNFFSLDSESEKWFKIFVPLNFENYRLKTLDKNNYQIRTNTSITNGIFENINSLMWDFMTGNAEIESDIENKFKLIE